MAKKKGNPEHEPGKNLPAAYDEAFAKYAKEAADKEVIGGSFISFQGGIMAIAGKNVEGNSLDVIIIDQCFENAFYEGKFSKDDKTPPLCFALGRDLETLEAHPNAKPGWQNMQVIEVDGKNVEKSPCQSPQCKQNVFGSDDRGKGKACGNKHRIALISIGETTTEADIRNSEVLYAKLAAVAGNEFPRYVKGLYEGFKRPPFGVITRLGCKPDAKSQFKVTFEMLGPVPKELSAAVIARHEAELGNTMFPYAAGASPGANEKKTKAPKGKGKKGGREKF